MHPHGGQVGPVGAPVGRRGDRCASILQRGRRQQPLQQGLVDRRQQPIHHGLVDLLHAELEHEDGLVEGAVGVAVVVIAVPARALNRALNRARDRDRARDRAAFLPDGHVGGCEGPRGPGRLGDGRSLG